MNEELRQRVDAVRRSVQDTSVSLDGLTDFMRIATWNLRFNAGATQWPGFWNQIGLDLLFLQESATPITDHAYVHDKLQLGHQAFLVQKPDPPRKRWRLTPYC